MPAYEYECAQCAKYFEIRQKMSDLPINACPKCGGALKRIISGGAGAICKDSHSYANAAASCGSGASCCSPMGGCCGGGFDQN